MKKLLLSILNEALATIEKASTQQELNELRAFYMGKKSPLGDIMKKMGSLSIEEKKTLGSYANTVKQEIEACATEKRKELERAQTLAKLEKEKIDITLPGKDFKAGTKHPLTQVIEEVEDNWKTFIVAFFPEVCNLVHSTHVDCFPNRSAT